MNYGQRILLWAKWRILRKYIKYSRKRKTLTPATELQERILLLWKLYVHYEESKLYCTVDSYTRQIDNDNLLLIYGVSGESYAISVKNRMSCYEIQLTFEQADMASEEFDKEVKRRMKKADQGKRSIIIKGLDEMIDVAENRPKTSDTDLPLTVVSRHIHEPILKITT